MLLDPDFGVSLIAKPLVLFKIYRFTHFISFILSSAFMSLAAKFPPKLKNDNKSRHDEGATVSIDTHESSVTNCCQSYVIVSHPEDDFEDPVNSLLPPENIGTQTPGGELGLPEISTKSGALEITAEPMIVIKEPTSAVELKAGFPPDKIPVVNAELKMRYLNCNHSSFLENPICREGCNSQTCEISEEVQRETEAILSDDTSQRKDAPWSLSRDFKAIETPRSHQLHLSSDLECETFDYIHNLETGSPVVDGSYVQLKEQASRIVKCTKCAHGRPPVCQGTCLKSGIGSCSRLLSATSLSIEFPAAKGSEKYTPFQNEESYKKEVDAHKAKTRRVGRNIDHSFDWDGLRKHAQEKNKQENNGNTMDSIDYEALRNANVSEIAKVIKRRGMNTMLAERIQDFVNGLVAKHGDTNLEWLRDILPDQAKYDI